MKTILLLGAGRSSFHLIEYLWAKSKEIPFLFRVADSNINVVKTHFIHLPDLEAIQIDITDKMQLEQLVQSVDIVISLLPAGFHFQVAQACLTFNKHFLCASYVSEEMKALDSEVRNADLLFLNECGLDPGIDHMSAMKLIDEIREEGGKITSFHSYCGGLMAKSNHYNPWEYRFTWNPDFVITAGRNGGEYLENGNLKVVDYQRLFYRVNPIDIPDEGVFDAYYNRDSLQYRNPYGLESIASIARYTLRREGFCEAWLPFVQLGMTENTRLVQLPAGSTKSDFLRMFLSDSGPNVQSNLQKEKGLIFNKSILEKWEYLGLFGEEQLSVSKGTAAQILKSIIEPKWTMQPDEKDQVFMVHHIDYIYKEQKAWKKSYLSVVGDDTLRTAMSKTVGLPLAIAALKTLTGEITERGVLIPVSPNLYNAILPELEQHGIAFKELGSSLA